MNAMDFDSAPVALCHPADELYDLRQRLQRLSQRASLLQRALLDGADCNGERWRAEAVRQVSLGLDRARLPAFIRSDLRYYSERSSTSLRLIPREAAGPEILHAPWSPLLRTENSVVP
ncbi:MAG: hypothetical protein AAGI34_05005 [Pseudomonadota bacterium]